MKEQHGVRSPLHPHTHTHTRSGAISRGQEQRGVVGGGGGRVPYPRRWALIAGRGSFACYEDTGGSDRLTWIRDWLARVSGILLPFMSVPPPRTGFVSLSLSVSVPLAVSLSLPLSLARSPSLSFSLASLSRSPICSSSSVSAGTDWSTPSSTQTLSPLVDTLLYPVLKVVQ